jgi:hypothetical protein
MPAPADAAKGLQARIWEAHAQKIEGAFADRLTTDEAYGRSGR